MPPIALEQTVDPRVVIVERNAAYVEYLSDDGQRWRIAGQCNLCGACYAGSRDAEVAINAPKLGTADAAERLDGSPWQMRPVRPEIADLPECVLTGRYL
jgi:hypothetical protein